MNNINIKNDNGTKSNNNTSNNQVVISEGTLALMNILKGISTFQEAAEEKFGDSDDDCDNEVLFAISESYRKVLDAIMDKIRDTIIETCATQL